jgi:hypothetical protein
MNAARHGDLLPIFGKMLENERAGGKPSVNRSSVNKPAVNKPAANKPSVNKPVVQTAAQI